MMEQLMRDFFNEFWSGADTGTFFDRDENGNPVVTMDVPGFNESNLEMEITKNVLRVKGENDQGRKLNKTIRLPFSPKEPNAKIKDGVLSVSFKTQEQIETSKVAIEHG